MREIYNAFKWMIFAGCLLMLFFVMECYEKSEKETKANLKFTIDQCVDENHRLAKELKKARKFIREHVD